MRVPRAPVFTVVRVGLFLESVFAEFAPPSTHQNKFATNDQPPRRCVPRALVPPFVVKRADFPCVISGPFIVPTAK